MSGEFKKKSTNLFVTIFIGFIVVSFMFTGYESMRGSPDTVGKVGNIPIKAREYQSEYSRQLNFYKQMMGGKDLSSQQIEQFRIKDNALRNLVQQKLVLKFADDAGIIPSSDEVKKTIKDMPYWQTNKQFDINKYKQILAANDWSPKEFEKDTITQIKNQGTQSFFSSFPLSDKYIESILRFKKMKVSADIVQFSKESLRKHITVSAPEISSYLAKEDNAARAENLFKERKPGLDKPEEVKASHILITAKPGKQKEALKKIEGIAKGLNTNNFSKVANKYTEDPSGKGKGGALNWFSRGKMVKEFDQVAFNQKIGTISKPIKSDFGYHLIYVMDKRKAVPALYKDHKKNIVKELVQKEKNNELDKMVISISSQLESALKSNSNSKIKSIKKKYRLSYEEKTTINKYDGSKGSIPIETDQLKQVFAADPTASPVISFNTPTRVMLVKISSYKAKKDEKDPTVNSEKKGMRTVLANKLRQNLIKNYQDNTKTKLYNNIR